MDVTGNVIADYMRGNTRIVILDDAIDCLLYTSRCV